MTNIFFNQKILELESDQEFQKDLERLTTEFDQKVSELNLLGAFKPVHKELKSLSKYIGANLEY